MRMATAVRMGLRYVRDLGESDVTRIETARLIGEGSPAPSISPSALVCP